MNLLIKDWLYLVGDNLLYRMIFRLYEYKFYDNGILFVYIIDMNNMEIICFVKNFRDRCFVKVIVF